jgi:hypothetical protein
LTVSTFSCDIAYSEDSNNRLRSKSWCSISRLTIRFPIGRWNFGIFHSIFHFLLTELTGAPRWAKDISKAANEAGIGPGSLKRAKRALGVRSEKAGVDEGWKWSLPEGDGPKGTDPIYEKPSPSSPSHEQAVSDPPEGDGFPEGDGYGDIGSLRVWDYTEGAA